MKKLKLVIEQAAKQGKIIYIFAPGSHGKEISFKLNKLGFTDVLPVTNGLIDARYCGVYPNIKEYQFLINPDRANTIEANYTDFYEETVRNMIPPKPLGTGRFGKNHVDVAKTEQYKEVETTD